MERYIKDNCGANWKGLIDQLEYEGITAAQIEHALNVTYARTALPT